MSSVRRYQTEKAIIDALLKISEIIKKTTGNGEKKQQRNKYDYDEIYHASKPSPMRRLERYVSGFNQQYGVSPSSQRPLNCNRAPIVLWNSRPYDKRYYSTRRKQTIKNDYRDEESAYKQHPYGISPPSVSSISDNEHRTKSSRYHVKHKSSGSNKRRRMKCACQTSYDDNEYNSASDC